MPKHSLRLLPLDYVISAVALVTLLLSLRPTFRSTQQQQPLVYIATESGEQVYPLQDTALTLTLTGPVGETEVAIREGAVRVLSSPGREQICVNKKEISRHGEWLICLPNRIFIRIAAAEGAGARGAGGGDAAEVDAHSY